MIIVIIKLDNGVLNSSCNITHKLHPDIEIVINAVQPPEGCSDHISIFISELGQKRMKQLYVYIT